MLSVKINNKSEFFLFRFLSNICVKREATASLGFFQQKSNSYLSVGPVQIYICIYVNIRFHARREDYMRRSIYIHLITERINKQKQRCKTNQYED